MATPHIESAKEEIAEIVLMPGDPLRAKFIAEHFLTDARKVNDVRNILGYTGFYKGTRITVFASGMGIPSMGIYAYELYQFYDVKKIVRIGSCGSANPTVRVRDIILADSAYSFSSFPRLFSGDLEKTMDATKELNDRIEKKALESNQKVHRGPIVTSDIFDVYVDSDKYWANYPTDIPFLGSEMEAFGLFYLAKLLGREAACLLTVVDSKYEKNIEVSSDERQTALVDMIELALESLS